MSTLVSLALAAALTSLAVLALFTRPSARGRHGGGSLTAVRALVPAFPVTAAATALLLWHDGLTLVLAGVGVWLLCLPWLPFTGHLGAWAHATWTLGATTGAALLTWSGWVVLNADGGALTLVGAWTLWLVVAAAAVSLGTYGWRVLAALAKTPAASSLAPQDPPAWKPRPVVPLGWLAGAAAAALLALVVQPGPAPGSGTLAHGSADVNPTGTASESTAVPSAVATTPAQSLTRTQQASSRDRTREPAPVATTSVARTAARTSTTRAPRPSTTSPLTGTTTVEPWTDAPLHTPPKWGHSNSPTKTK